jgi:hypothetical protein
MTAAQNAIPYESQSELGGNRACGAACLSMVYRSFGKEVPQSEIWATIAKPNRHGVVSSTTHLMTQDALTRGFAAIAIQARYPLQVLRLCRDSGVRVILNHRTRPDGPSGHYSVLAALEERDVVLHDPAYGPSRRISHSELLELWQPRFQDSEIVGNVLIAVAAPPVPEAPACEFCHTSLPSAIGCPACRKPVPIVPGAPLGCVNTACIARIWNFICCPFCDSAFTFTRDTQSAPSPPPPSDPATAPASGPAPINLDPVFAAIDKFTAQVLAIPAAAKHPDIKKSLDLMASGKERLRLNLAEAIANQKADREKLASLEQLARQGKERHEKQLEELNAQSPPLDAKALGRALLKNLGFT